MVSTASSQQYGIIDNSESPHVKLKAIGIGDCRWTSGFWGDKHKQCEEVMVPYMGSVLKGDIGHGYDNFKIAAGLKKGDHQGHWWHDGDFYKWMESAVYIYAFNKDEAIGDDLDEIIKIIGMAQEDDGYLSTHVTIRDDIERWSNRQYHELYNSGHLLTSACIHHRITGKTNFLDIAVKHADYLYDLFQPRPPELARFGFNPSQIMGLVELYRTTRDQRYLELAGIFIDMRGDGPIQALTVNAQFQGDMCQDRVPFREETEAVGHSVLAMYLYAGVADVYAEIGEQALLDALDRIWADVVDKKMYITGAVGQTHHGASSRVDFVHEAFINEYMMPNSTAYNETCANIANAMFNWRMLAAKGEARYGDIMELVLYNSALSGIGVDGKSYFYANPLRVTSKAREDTETEFFTRKPYIECFCCPPNLVRTIAKSSGWGYSVAENGVSVNLYGSNTLNSRLQDRSAIALTQDTQHPWDGKVTLTVDVCKDEAFDIMLRIPGWAADSTVLVNDQDAGIAVMPGTFATITRAWKAGDVVELDMPMEPKLLVGHPRIEETRNQAAIKRGPVVYCVETPDLPEGTSILDVYLPSDVTLAVDDRPDFLGGVSMLKGTVLLHADNKDAMYSALIKPDWKAVDINFVPYYAWCNRGKSEMTVWLPIIWR